MSNRIKRIQVDKLFGKYDYNIDIANDEDVSIVIAPNGCGKTTIFKMIDAFLNCSLYSFYDIKDVPFERFECELSSGDTIIVNRTYDMLHEPTDPSMIRERRNVRYEKIFYRLGLNFLIFIALKDEMVDGAGPLHEFSIIDELLADEGTPVALGQLVRGAHTNFDSKEPIKCFFDDFSNLLSRTFDGLNGMYEACGCATRINYISANRLGLHTALPMRRRFSRDDEDEFENSPLVSASKSITSKTFSKIETYNSYKTKAQNSLPGLYLKSGKSQGFEEFAPKWQSYLEELEKFNDLGFLSDVDASSIKSITKEEYDKFGQFLDTYLDLFTKTIKPLNEDYEKFRLFKEIFDTRNEITGKYIKFTSKGLEIHLKGEPDENGEDRKLDITRLSSGEKHDFIMFYNLIFAAPANGIVLIDEPEISLHIEWQEEFVDRLIDICAMNGLQAIVATHSPHIINSHFDILKDL